MTLAQLKTQVLSRLEPLTSAPTYNAIHNDQYQRWADEKIPVVVTEFVKAGRIEAIQGLIVPDISVTITSGIGAFSFSDYFLPLSLTVTSARVQVQLLTAPDEFYRWDSGSFVVTPRTARPVGIIMNSTVYVKPTNLATPAYLTYIKNHNPLFDAQETLFNDEGDAMLIELVYQEASKALEIMEE